MDFESQKVIERITNLTVIILRKKRTKKKKKEERKEKQPSFVTALDLDLLDHAQKIKIKSPMSW